LRGRPYFVEPEAVLHQLGYPSEAVQDVVITHLHYDHAGNIGDYSHAKIWLQERELLFATGKCMCEPTLNHFFAPEDISQLVKRLYLGDVRLLSGNHVLHDGIELYAVGGHTDGLQIVRVRTKEGWTVLASDATHFYENLEARNPFPPVFNMANMLDGYALIEKLAEGRERIIPGHDPLVRERYPRVGSVAPHAYRIA
jgi:glyoxylase-like metal-dependent hydrolase (beta-lactamase superfamily II)